MEKKQKIGMSIGNWILSILGILIFSSFIILPPVFRSFLNEEESNPPVLPSPSATATPNLEENYTRVVCTKNGIDQEEEYIIYAKGETVEMFAQTLTQHYLEITEETQTICNNENTLYQGLSGFYHECRIKGNDVITSSRITFQEYRSAEIPIPFDFSQTASALKQDIVASGFTCKE